MKRKLKNILSITLIIILVITSFITIYFISNNNSLNDNKFQDNKDISLEKDFNNIKNDENNNENQMLPEMPNSLDNKNEFNINDNNIKFNVYYILFIIQNIVISMLFIYLVMSKLNKKTLKQTFYSKDKITIYILSIIILTSILTFTENYIIENYFLNKSNNQMNQNNINKDEKNISYSGSYEIKEDTNISSGNYVSNESNKNTILVSESINANIENVNIEKTGDSNMGDDTSFYGINSAVLAKDKANLNLKNVNIITDAYGANGVFSYGGSATTKNTSSDGTTITISDSTITTKKDNSGGIMTTGGGTTNAYNLKVNTSGISSAAIRTDRGGGVVNVDKGTYITEGNGSPSIYSTAKIIVKNATLTSKVAEGIVIEGKNNVEIDNCNLTSSNTKLNGLSTTYKNIFLYQSMSGDAKLGTSSFKASNSNIITNNGDTFYITNTSSSINLVNNTIINNDKTGNFLRAKADSWGKDGSNGADVTLSLDNQKVVGNIVIDNISKLDMVVSNNSYYEGIINEDDTALSITLKLDKTSKIKLTGNSYLHSLDNEDSSNSNIDFNGYKLYINKKTIN